MTFSFGNRVCKFYRNPSNGARIYSRESKRAVFSNGLTTIQDSKVYTCGFKFEDGYIIFTDLLLLDDVKIIEHLIIQEKHKISKIKEIFLRKILNRSTITECFWEIIDRLDLPDWVSNFKLGVVSCDPTPVRIAKNIIKFLRRKKRKILIFFFLLILTYLFHRFGLNEYLSKSIWFQDLDFFLLSLSILYIFIPEEK